MSSTELTPTQLDDQIEQTQPFGVGPQSSESSDSSSLPHLTDYFQASGIVTLTEEIKNDNDNHSKPKPKRIFYETKYSLSPLNKVHQTDPIYPGHFNSKLMNISKGLHSPKDLFNRIQAKSFLNLLPSINLNNNKHIDLMTNDYLDNDSSPLNLLNLVTFGIECTFTNKKLIDLARSNKVKLYDDLYHYYLDKYIDHITKLKSENFKLLEIKQAFDKYNSKQIKCKIESNRKIKKSNNGENKYFIEKIIFEIVFHSDDWVIEFTLSPISLYQLYHHAKTLQTFIFNATQSIGLIPHTRIGGGHIHIDKFIFNLFNDSSHHNFKYNNNNNDNINHSTLITKELEKNNNLYVPADILFRDFLVDCYNNPLLFLGGFSFDLLNSPPLAILNQNQQNSFKQIIHSFDQKYIFNKNRHNMDLSPCTKDSMKINSINKNKYLFEGSDRISELCHLINNHVYTHSFIDMINDKNNDNNNKENNNNKLDQEKVDKDSDNNKDNNDYCESDYYYLHQNKFQSINLLHLETIEIRGFKPQKSIYEIIVLIQIIIGRIFYLAKRFHQDNQQNLINLNNNYSPSTISLLKFNKKAHIMKELNKKIKYRVENNQYYYSSSISPLLLFQEFFLFIFHSIYSLPWYNHVFHQLEHHYVYEPLFKLFILFSQASRPHSLNKVYPFSVNHHYNLLMDNNNYNSTIEQYRYHDKDPSINVVEAYIKSFILSLHLMNNETCKQLWKIFFL